ncbi:MAG: 50S ribosomal protein L13 [Pseudomonadota bacterium]
MPTKTYMQKKEEAQRNWRVVDATGQVLGRLCSQIAIVLRGKDKPTFTPHVDGGDFVIVVNAEKVALTGDKLNKKLYRHHTGYRGGVVTKTAKQMIDTDVEEMFRLAVWGMLPKGPLGRDVIGKLKVYRGPSHPHEAQQPKPMNVSA